MQWKVVCEFQLVLKLCDFPCREQVSVDILLLSRRLQSVPSNRRGLKDVDALRG